MKIKQLKLNGTAFYPKVGVDSIVDAAGTESAVDTVVTENSTNLVTSGAVYNAVPTKTSDLTNDSNFVNQSQLSGKQDQLVSGTNIKTINGNSLLGSGNIDVAIDIDDHLDDESENAIQNKPVAEAIEAEVTRAQAAEAAILNLYESLSQSAIEVVDTLPQTGEVNKIYRLVGTTSYSDYMYNTDDLNTPILMAIYNNAVESRPKKASLNLVTSGGVFDNMGALDVSELNATENPHTLAQYVDLSAALTAVPTDYQKGGMSIKFVQSSDNKYVQYRLTSPSFNTTVSNWVTDNDAVKPDYTELDGLLSNTGSIVSGTRFYHTSPIEVKIGQSLLVKNAVQVNSSISSIALVQEDGTFIMPIYQHGTYGKWDYLFIPVKDCYVSVSYYTPDNGDNNTIGIVKSNDNYEKKLSTLKSWLYTESYVIKSGTVIRDADGNVSSSDVWYPDKTLGHVSVTRDTNFNVTQLLFAYLNENITMTISRDANGYVTGTSITI